MSQVLPTGPEKRARVLFGDLVEGRWEEAHRDFDVSLRVDVGRIARGWTSVAGSAGSLERMDAPSARQSGGYTVVDVPLTFGAGNAAGRVVFDRDGKVTGLSLEYPRRRRLDPRRVRAFVLQNPEVARLRLLGYS
jgi:Protein of unknown function (DUF3887)